MADASRESAVDVIHEVINRVLGGSESESKRALQKALSDYADERGLDITITETRAFLRELRFAASTLEHALQARKQGGAVNTREKPSRHPR